MHRNQPESVKPNIRGRKVRKNVNLQGVLNKKGVKQGLGVLCWESWSGHTLEKRRTERVRLVKYNGVNSVSAMLILRNQNTCCEAEDVTTEVNYV